MDKIQLKGITWDHSRGYTPLVAASQRYHELHPQVEITWTKRSLQEFADFPIEKLAETFDLLVIDHPWVGFASRTASVHALDQLLSSEFLDNLTTHSVGASFSSYYYDGHLWALPIDAATPVASYRYDLLDDAGIDLPTTWHDVMTLARMGRVAAPGIEVDVLMNFYMFCNALGETPFTMRDLMVKEETGVKVLGIMREFYNCIHPDFFACNPIAVAEKMSNSNDFIYCPFSYGYSNYSREGYARNQLKYTDLVSYNGKQFVSTLGGTGLAISANTNYLPVAADFTAWIAGELHQRTMYTMSGGQPGHRSAWLCLKNNGMTQQFFLNTLPALDRAFVRPRYPGYLHFQDHAGLPLQQFLRHGGHPKEVLACMNEFYRQSRVLQNSFNEVYA
jgi:multiple sugar transport system substrate-binding protein